MIAYDFDYYQPDTPREAVDIFVSLQRQGKRPFYYGGGTEIISLSRIFALKPDAVIDIKGIPDCGAVGPDRGRLFFGAAATLNEVAESGLFPLLGRAAARIADHTIQCKITLGGNLAGMIHYRETMLPLFLADAALHLQTPSGMRRAGVESVFSSGRRLAPGELVVGVSLDRRYAALQYAHMKRTTIEKIGYPLVTVCAMHADGIMGTAACGLCAFPFRFGNIRIEGGSPASALAERLAAEIPAPVLDDATGSAGYREFILKRTLEQIIGEFRSDRGG